MMWLPFALACPACAPARPEAADYGRQSLLHLDANQPAPFAGWLVSDQDLEWLVKAAQDRNAQDANGLGP
jgi:hypothetical protein